MDRTKAWTWIHSLSALTTSRTVLKIINSFDLKSAIDRAWLGLQSALIAQLFENSLSAFVCSAFRSYPFRAPFLKKIPQVKSLTLRVGQPLFGLGYYFTPLGLSSLLLTIYW